MKRVAAIVLVLMLVFACAVSTAAQDSPTGKEYLKIVAIAEGPGTASTSANKVEKGSGDTVVLTATPDNSYFTRWIIKGEYDLVEGEGMEDEVLTIRPKTDIEAIASFRVDKDYLTMSAEARTPGHDTAAVEPVKVPMDGRTTATFTATEVDGTFIEWEFQCEYKLVSGDLKSKVVTIIPYTDVHGIAYFNTGAKPDNPNDSDTAPKTGDPIVYAVPIMLLALCAAVVAAKKLKEN